MSWRIINADCLAILETIATDSIDAIVTDPPAGIGFMGKEWDRDKGGRHEWIGWMTGNWRRRDDLFPDRPPSGWCQCGCGERTRISRHTVARLGWGAGVPLSFVNGHQSRRHGWLIRPETAPTWMAPELGDCWIWPTASEMAYGRCKVGDRLIPIHRHLYVTYVRALRKTEQLDHLCRRRPCINYSHLEPVTCAVNIQRGILTKLTEGDVAEIRRLRGCVLQRELAERFGVTSSNISHIQRGHSWPSRQGENHDAP